jgi:1-acyl-sn-glycerol-3-phosphate acyltransferase
MNIRGKIKDYAGKAVRVARVTRRLLTIAAAVPVMLGAVAAQALVAGPIFKNYSTIPNGVIKLARRLMGLKVVFNEVSAPVVKDQPTWFVANHLSTADPFVLGDKLNGTFAGKGELLKSAWIAPIVKAVKYIGLRRSKEFNPQSRGKIINNFNEGNNLVMFPEATTSDGMTVKMFHAGLITALFGEKGVNEEGQEVRLKKDVVVQPVAIRVLEVDGKNAIRNKKLMGAYTREYGESPLHRVFERLSHKKITVEVTTLPPLNPADFADARALINHAAQDVANVVNPGQTTFEKAVIPHKGDKKKTKELACCVPSSPR